MSAEPGNCRDCPNAPPLTRIFFKSHKWWQRVHFVCLQCEPNWLEEAIEERDKESDSDEEEWCIDCGQHAEDGCLADCSLRKEREEEEEEENKKKEEDKKEESASG